ncbi:MAG TPA: IS481 family transposase, partial [Gaiellaceae bacterium]
MHVCVDDFSRLAYVEVLSDVRATTAIGFLRRALEWFAAQGVRVERVMTGAAQNERRRYRRRSLGSSLSTV